jgi:hypothetical protein
MMSQQYRPPATSPPSGPSRAREPKAPPPSKFQGKAEQVETFIRQCENVFSIESLSFTSEEVKISYAGNLMEGEAAIRWYEAYNNSIDQASANRLAGMQVNYIKDGSTGIPLCMLLEQPWVKPSPEMML